MSWPEHPYPALQEYITERQSVALSTYEIDHNLLVEHVRQEDSFRTGGYGTRQIPELMQNAVDALSAAGTGRVEFRLADGALYCANEGAAFDEAGIRAITYAFLSEKRGEEIGRFGLGFKSVLGVSDRPQIFSRSVSFAFNAPDTAELFAGVPSAGGRYPLLRVPSLIDGQAAAREDRNLADMMEWATTIVKLPLIREGARLRKELQEFKPQSLLFFKALETLTITLQGKPGTPLESTEFSRRGHPDDGEVELIGGDGTAQIWHYAEREYRPTPEVAATLPATALRESMTVSYAVRQGGRSSTGQLWAWFPLLDETTASGTFNAPWQINDDRTSLVAGSPLNRALLGVAADLFLDVVVRASSPENPAAHLDLFPARGREVRSNADKFLSSEIPNRARSRAMIPDTTGVLRVPTHFKQVPDLEKTPLTVTAARIWQEHVSRTNMPHADCFSSPTRRTRLRTLLGGQDGERSTLESGLAVWLMELTQGGAPERVMAALEIMGELRRGSPAAFDAGLSIPIIPLEGDGWASLSQARAVLLPAGGAIAPEGVSMVREDIATSARTVLQEFGFRDVSVDETASALAASASDRWDESDWERLWKALAAATPSVAITALERIRARDVGVRMRNMAGDWRAADDLIADGTIASEVASRQVDPTLVPNLALRKAAGAIASPHRDRPLWRDGLWGDYTSAIEQMVRTYLAKNGYRTQTLVIPDMPGVGPLDLLQEELSEQDRVEWTSGILSQMSALEYLLDVPVGGGQSAEIRVSTMEWWAVRHRGLLMTSRGPAPVSGSVAGALAKYAAFLPVALGDSAIGIPLPKTLEDVPVRMLQDFLSTEAAAVPQTPAFGELLAECARREDLPIPERIPAVVGAQVVLTPPEQVAVVEPGADIVRDLREAGVAYVPLEGDDTALTENWGLLSAEAALHQTVEVVGATEPVPLLDMHPSLQNQVSTPLARATVARATVIERVLHSVAGVKKQRMRMTVDGQAVTVDASLDAEAVLVEVSRALELGLTRDDVAAVFRADEELQRSELILQARSARNDEQRLLLLAGPEALRTTLPAGLLDAVEANTGTLTERSIAELFLRVHGHDSVRELRDVLRRRGIPIPDRWDGSPAALAAVKNLGFDTAFAGTKDVRPGAVSHVPGRITLNPLHDYQREVADKIGTLVAAEDADEMRGLLYLPTGAGKTRVTVEALLRLMKAGQIQSPVLWIAQSEELCEQAIHSFSEVWRWLGDERPLDVSRFWSGYELDESEEELHVVVAIDATLTRRLGEPQYDWLTKAGIVVIDEAHTALSGSYTDILRHMGLTAARTDRPLLGLTATPFRGRNDEVNRLFAQRFGNNRLESLDPDDPIGQLRAERVLSEVDYDLLTGITVGVGQQDAEFKRLKEVTPGMLAEIGRDMKRTLKVVEHIKKQDQSWPILVFAASVASAHTIAALLRLDGVRADSVDGGMRRQHRRRVIEQFKSGETQVLVNCDLLTQGFDAPQVRALYIARPTFSPNRYLQMVGRGLRGPANGGTERCLIVNVKDTFEQFGEELAYNEFDYLWSKA